MKTLLERLLEAGYPKNEMYHHCSDLYVFVTPVTTKIITNKDNRFRESKLDKSNALISCFPDELQETIVPKAVKSDTVYNDITGNNVTTYDKLWLLSASEQFGYVFRPNEGNHYQRNKILGILNQKDNADRDYKNSIYNETDNSNMYKWTRTLYSGYPSNIRIVGNNYTLIPANYGAYGQVNISNIGICPGFCFPGPDPDVKYAVSVYGINQDNYLYDEEFLIPAPLTFGPATGASFIDDYISRDHNGADHTGTTESGNKYRCIHDDDWDEIIEWSDKDPYVYEKCMGDSKRIRWIDRMSTTRN